MHNSCPSELVKIFINILNAMDNLRQSNKIFQNVETICNPDSKDHL